MTRGIIHHSSAENLNIKYDFIERNENQFEKCHSINKIQI